ncbi:MAG: sugar phosphate isomerase/epimerase, partial [Fidelibacterota bacterium]
MLSKDIVLAYLYFISKYGYPPPAEDTPDYLKTTHSLGFSSVELEGIRADHLLAMYSQRSHIKAQLQELGLKCPYFCIVLPDIASCDEAERDRNLGLF